MMDILCLHFDDSKIDIHVIIYNEYIFLVINYDNIQI